MKKQLPQTYDKAGAAAYLQVSERAIERYTKKGLLTPDTVMQPSATDGRTRPHNIYRKTDLDEVKEKMKEQAEKTTSSTALTLATKPDSLANLFAQIADINRAHQPAAPVVSVAEKLTLKLAEAARLAGLSQNFLRAAIAAGQLRAAKRGRGWNIKRADLESFIEDL